MRRHALIVTSLLALAACSDPESAATKAAPDTHTAAGFGDDTMIVLGSDTDETPSSQDDATSGPKDVTGAVDTGAAPDAAESVDTPAAPKDAAAPNDSGTAAEDASKPESGNPQIIVDPESYTFSYVSPLPASLVRQISIYNGGSASLTITALGLVPGSSPDFILSAIPPLPKVLQPGDSTLGLIVFNEVAGGAGTLRVTSNDPARPTVDVELKSYLKADLSGPEPCAALKPTAINFGNVKRGDTKILSATLSNCSKDAPLTLKNIVRGTTFFMPLTQEIQLVTPPPFPTVIPAGGSFTVNVSYTPDLAGPDLGNFILETDDPNEPKVKLDVSGFGTEPPPEEIGLTIKLTWNSNLCDVDSHLIQPGGTFFDCVSDCYFGNPSPEWGAPGQWKDNPYLDVDDVDGFGPEHTNITEPVPGTYRFRVHYYDDSYEGSFGTETDATVEVYSFGTLLATFGPQHLDVTNRTWDVFDVAWPSLQITPLGAMTMATTTGGFCFP